MNYWKECISEAFDEAGIVATDEQVDTVVFWVEGASENRDMAYGYDVASENLSAAPDPKIEILEAQIASLEAELEVYQNSVKTRRRADHVWVEGGSVYYR